MSTEEHTLSLCSCIVLTQAPKKTSYPLCGSSLLKTSHQHDARPRGIADVDIKVLAKMMVIKVTTSKNDYRSTGDRGGQGNKSGNHNDTEDDNGKKRGDGCGRGIQRSRDYEGINRAFMT